MPGIADKFTQSAQGRLLWPGMTKIYAQAALRPSTVPIGSSLSQR
jgi:hypothetical protein